MTLHEQKIVSILKKRWVTQMDMAQASITLNLSKRLGELKPKLELDGWKIERRWKATGTVKCKEYKLSRA